MKLYPFFDREGAHVDRIANAIILATVASAVIGVPLGLYLRGQKEARVEALFAECVKERAAYECAALRSLWWRGS